MSKRMAVVAIAATAMMGFAVSQAPAGKKHSHQTIQKYAQAPVFTPAFDVGSGSVTCPSGSVATGGGAEYVDGVAHVLAMGFRGTNTYYVLVDNFDNSIPSTFNVQVACTAGTSRARGRVLSRAAVERSLDQMVAELRASRREAE